MAKDIILQFSREDEIVLKELIFITHQAFDVVPQVNLKTAYIKALAKTEMLVLNALAIARANDLLPESDLVKMLDAIENNDHARTVTSAFTLYHALQYPGDYQDLLKQLQSIVSFGAIATLATHKTPSSELSWQYSDCLNRSKTLYQDIWYAT